MGAGRRRTGGNGSQVDSTGSTAKKRTAANRTNSVGSSSVGSVRVFTVILLAVAIVGGWIAIRRIGSSGETAAQEEVARLQSIFDPPRSSGGYPIDSESASLLSVLSAVAPGAAAKIRTQLRENPLQLGGRLGLCDALERHSLPSRPEGQRFAELCLCYRRFMEAFDFAESLPESDARRQPLLNMQSTAGRVAGDRMVTFSESKADRLQDAVAFLRKGLLGGVGCAKDPNECVAAGANLLLALRLQEAPERELQAALSDVRRTPGLSIAWPDPLSIHLQMPGIRHQGFWDPSDIAWLPDVAEQWQTIREELDRYLEERAKSAKDLAWEHRPDSGYLAGAAQWNSVNLFKEGVWQEENCRIYFPRTCAMLRERAELQPANFRWPAAVLGQPGGSSKQKPPVLMVNIYQALPGARIRPHFGTHGRLVASLGLRSPPGAVLQVGNEKRTWQEGHWLLFDDSFMHEVVNGAAEPRYVLAVAMLHPDCCTGC